MSKCFDCKKEAPLFSVPEPTTQGLSIAVCVDCLKIRQTPKKK